MTQTHKKVAVFTGTRAEYGLLFWLLKDIQSDPDLTLQLLVSGMHLSPEFGDTYKQIEKDGFNIDEKIEILLSSDSAVGTAKSMGLGVLGFADALSRLAPDVLVILGDRFEALAAAQTAMILRIPIIHLHGGEITEGAYDDAIRHAITKLSYLHGTSTDEYRNRVIQLGESPARVRNIGAIGLDHLNRASFMTVSELSELLSFELKKPYFVVTYHPVTLGNEAPEESFQSLLDALDEFPDHQVILTYPNADDGGRRIIPMLEDYAASQPKRVLAIPSLGQVRYLSSVKHAAAVIGNSSSGIIEVPAFDVPTVNIGTRQKGRLAAKSVLNTTATKESISNAIGLAVSRKYKAEDENIANPYGQGDSSKQVIEMIKGLDFDPCKSFYDVNIEPDLNKKVE
ncbi:TPA: UDP-N-acetylglucosamine 2-epimerase (hydrolyzing) [Vibrio parahaemolyticus]|uniref:UDP-N-acetylglucosamine 2-epimerase n=1 Tax=Vibrio parahaemolyticus TaxID=670 RepID=UPI000813BD58|nr:UDP-N-acetylglucosamine 2-epimerase [Vibrio parahaemolyticus]EGQ8312454.1 UDP-N-acetylglucosamine 2-epimerase (hydrolyzing) [Vibrio parahaemolyticus]EGQ8850338.1 UDP-N-acetylglucosamine 2-epimerase (hydrolyzing) [Vibrio parahaemolyticus]EGQ8854529.1 UDP-N-acetylglucosamine 2-epimerase (hydrolyzing) [Vibrio parahaemolyticus]EGQ8873775.1 UDP-N-acetylglucosamine 2-epimerase (hydrolyzing) [Vibrio parahaemolyticus]EGQ8993489.1 UDP-N-acetylglucosamine 2-epimerase (hydrolyzing) [Vibrio parahaemoly